MGRRRPSPGRRRPADRYCPNCRRAGRRTRRNHRCRQSPTDGGVPAESGAPAPPPPDGALPSPSPSSGLRLRQAVIGLLDADAVPGLGVRRQGEPRVPQQTRGSPAATHAASFRGRAAPRRVWCLRAQASTTRAMAVSMTCACGVGDPHGRIADLAPVAGHGLAAGVRADRQPQAPGCRRRAARAAMRSRNR